MRRVKRHEYASHSAVTLELMIDALPEAAKIAAAHKHRKLKGLSKQQLVQNLLVAFETLFSP